MNLDERVRRLQKLADPDRRRADAAWRDVRRAFDRRVAVLLRFYEALPPERAEAVCAAVRPHLEGCVLPDGEARLKDAPSVARLIRAFGDPLRKLRFPDPLPVEWLDLYLAHPTAEAVTDRCPRCGLVHPGYRNYTLPADTPWKSSDGTTHTVKAGGWYQTYPLAPDWRCVVCRGLLGGRVEPHWPTSLGSALLSNGGRLEWRRDGRTRERLPHLIPADPDPCSEFTVPDTLELAR